MTLDHLTELESLHDLVADSRKGYQEAGNKTRDHSIAKYLMQLCEEREQMRIALETTIKHFAPEHAELRENSIKTGFPPAWLNIREKLAGAGDADMLAVCERAESYIFARYTKAVAAEPRPSEVQDLLIQQRMQVQESLYVLERSNTAMAWSAI